MSSIMNNIKISFDPTKRKMSKEELQLHLQAKRGCGAHKSNKDYNRKKDKQGLRSL